MDAEVVTVLLWLSPLAVPFSAMTTEVLAVLLWESPEEVPLSTMETGQVVLPREPSQASDDALASTMEAMAWRMEDCESADTMSDSVIEAVMTPLC